MKRLVLTAVLSIALGSITMPASADRGVGITPGSVSIDDRLEPGGRYPLPSLTVTNTGDVRQDYHIAVIDYTEGETRKPPRNWISLDPEKFTLEPGEVQPVEVDVRLPGAAEPGDYFTLIEAQMLISGRQGIQGSVATKLSFSVDESGWLETLRRQVNRRLDDAAPWIYVLPLLGVGAVALKLTSHRFRFRLPFEPR